MGQPVLRNRVLEGAGDMRLSDEIIKRLGSIFSGEDLVAHKFILDALFRVRK